MHSNILKKCIEELAKDSPSLDYIRGMLETIVAMDEAKVSSASSFLPHHAPGERTLDPIPVHLGGGVGTTGPLMSPAVDGLPPFSIAEVKKAEQNTGHE